MALIDTQELRNVTANGLWKQNSTLVQILGMCPVLAITTTMVNGAMISFATLLVMASGNLIVALLRNYIPYEIRIPVFILIAAAMVTLIDLLMNAYLHGLYLVLGIFIPLIITNCLVLARIEAFAAKHNPISSAWDGAMMGMGMVWTLSLLGAIREFIGTGAILGGIDLVFPSLQPIQILPEAYPGLLWAILPPGAFTVLGFLVAWRNWVIARQAARHQQPIPQPLATGGCH